MRAVISQNQAAVLVAHHIRRAYSRQALQKHIKTGALKACVVRDESGEVVGIDADLVVDEYTKNVDTSRRRGALEVSAPAKPKPDAPPAPTKADLKRRVELLPDDQIPDLQTSRERREHYQAELSKIEVDARRGELVPVEQVKKEAFTAGRVVRDALLNIPDRVAHQLAGEADPGAIHQLLSGEIVQALGGLACG